jgi:hypothetical protein
MAKRKLNRKKFVPQIQNWHDVMAVWAYGLENGNEEIKKKCRSEILKIGKMLDESNFRPDLKTAK